jgi:hypothetical protein
VYISIRGVEEKPDIEHKNGEERVKGECEEGKALL